MKRNPDFILRNIGDVYLIVPLNAIDYSDKNIITTNETGAILWRELQNENTKKGLLATIQNIYDIDDKTALSDITFFLETLKKSGALLD